MLGVFGGVQGCWGALMAVIPLLGLDISTGVCLRFINTCGRLIAVTTRVQRRWRARRSLGRWACSRATCTCPSTLD